MPSYVCRIYNKDCFDVLRHHWEIAIDEPEATRPLTERFLRSLARRGVMGHKEFRAFRHAEPGAPVLLLATQHWYDTEGVAGSTVIGLATLGEEYRFTKRRWRHRYPVQVRTLLLNDSGQPYLSLDDLHIRLRPARQRFVRDKQELVAAVQAAIESSPLGRVVRSGHRPPEPPPHARVSRHRLRCVPGPPLLPVKVTGGRRSFPKGQIDYVAKAEETGRIGVLGEELVVAYERQRLLKVGRRDLANRVCRVSETEGDGAGYDVKSFTSGGAARHIEVKATRQASNYTAFHLSANELSFAQHHSGTYRLYRLFSVENDPRFFIVESPHTLDRQATEYRVFPGRRRRKQPRE